MIVISQSALLAAIDAVTVALSGSHKVALFKNDYTPTSNTVIGDLEEADFTGYAAVTNSGWLAAAWATQGAAYQYMDTPAIFQPTGTTVSNVIYGWYFYATGTPNVYILGERFASPIPMNDPGDQIMVIGAYAIADAGFPGVVN